MTRPTGRRVGRHPGHHRVHPRRPGLPASGRRSGCRRSASARSTSSVGPSPVAAGACHRDPRATSTPPSGCPSPPSSSTRRGSAAASCTTTSSSRSSTTCSGSSPAAAVPAHAGPYGHYCLGIDLERSHEFERDRARLRGHQARLGTRDNFNYFISEARLRSPSSTPCASWPATAGGCSGTTASTRRPGAGTTGEGRSRPPLRLAQVGYDADGRLTYPREHERAPESALQDYLREAKPCCRRRARVTGTVPSQPTSTTCAGSSCPGEACQARDAERGW